MSANFQLEISRRVVVCFAGRDSALNTVKIIAVQRHIDGKGGFLRAVIDFFGKKLIILLINKIEYGHQHMTESGFARCIAAHDNIHFFIAEVGATFQMLFLDAGANYFFRVCQLHMEVFKCVEVIQTNIQNYHNSPLTFYLFGIHEVIHY